MKTKHFYISALSVISILSTTLFSSCSKEFLKPDPLSFYEPGATFSTRSGLDAALALADRHLRTYWGGLQTRDAWVPITTEYMLSDMAVSGKTDAGTIIADVAARLTPPVVRQSGGWGKRKSKICK